MTPARFNHVRDTFLRAAHMTPGQRTNFLYELKSDDNDLHLLVTDMLASEQQPAVLPEAGLRAGVDQLWHDFRSAAHADELPAELIPTQVGPYRVLRKINEGGMGAVYEAEQQHPQRRVALKLLRPGTAGPEALQRFRREIHVLGRLHHPGIAHVYEAGETRVAGCVQPYFAMELVRGPNITEYARRLPPGGRERVELIARLCDAIDHAHLHDVIHRDLKPSNVLVDVAVAGGQPKILDFGVARALNSDVQMTTLHTHAGQVIGTLSYMSPEQAVGEVSRIDVRSDVYSLGVLAYELLSGAMPYQLCNCSMPQAVRVIQETEPRRLGLVSPLYRGDLEIIVATTLSKDPRRRYQSAAELAADLRRFLNNQPIQARPAGRLYQIKKFTARHRSLVGGLTLAMVILLSGLITSTTLWLSVREERDKTRMALADSEAVTTFLTDLLQSATPEAAADRLLVRDLLDQVAVSVRERFEDRPLIEARISDTLGGAYQVMSDPEGAEPFLKRALEIRRAELGPRHPTTTVSLRRWADLLLAKGFDHQAEAVIQEAIAIQTELFGADRDPTLDSLEVLGSVYNVQGRFEMALDLRRHIYDTRRSVNGPNHPATIHSARVLGSSLATLQRFDEAEPIYESVLKAADRITAWDLCSIKLSLAILYSQTARLNQADALFAENEAQLQRFFGDNRHIVLKNRTEIGCLRVLQGRDAEAEPILTDVMHRARSALGPRHTHTLWTTYCLIRLLLDNRKFHKALPIAQQAVHDTHATAPGFLVLLARTHRGLNQHPEADQLEAQAARTPDLGAHAWQRQSPL